VKRPWRRQQPQPAASRKEADLMDRAIVLVPLHLDVYQPHRARQVVKEALRR
jgi:hypothetical protein